MNVTLRLPVSVVEKLDAEARDRSARFDMDVKRTDVGRGIILGHFREKEGACPSKDQTPK